MKTLMTLALLLSYSLIYGQQESTHYEVSCDSKEISFYDDADFLFNARNVITIKKRDGVNSFKDLTDQEIKMLKKEAKKLKCCLVICDFDYQTPTSLKDFDEMKENEKKKYFHFYISKRSEKYN
jgi:hypothetical protein